MITGTLIDGTFHAVTGISALVTQIVSRTSLAFPLVFAIANAVVVIIVAVNVKPIEVGIPN